MISYLSLSLFLFIYLSHSLSIHPSIIYHLHLYKFSALFNEKPGRRRNMEKFCLALIILAALGLIIGLIAYLACEQKSYNLCKNLMPHSVQWLKRTTCIKVIPYFCFIFYFSISFFAANSPRNTSDYVMVEPNYPSSKKIHIY